MRSAGVIVVGADVDGQLAKFQRADVASADNPYFVCLDTLPLARAGYAAGKGWLRHVDGAPVLAEGAPVAAMPLAAALDIPADERQAFLAWVRLRYSQCLIAEHQLPDLRGEHKLGWLRINAAGQVMELVDRTILQGRWSGWRVGRQMLGVQTSGAGFFQLKPGAPGAAGSAVQAAPRRADSALKGTIDIDAMREEAAIDAGAQWDLAQAAAAAMAPASKAHEAQGAREAHIAAARAAPFGDLACVVAEGRLHRQYRALLDRLPDDAVLVYVTVTLPIPLNGA